MGNTINIDKYVGIGFRGIIPSAIDPSAAAYFSATGITGATQQTAIDNLVKGLKADGLWSKMKAVYPFVTDNRNLTSYTEDFSNAYWARQASTISANTTTAPNGTNTADSLIESTANADHYVSTTQVGFGQNGNNTFSIYAKANTRNWLFIYINNGTNSLVSYFNLSNGTLGTVQSGLTANIENVGNGWYRCSVTRNWNFAIGGNGGYGIALNDNVTTYAGNGTSGIYIWGAQVDAAATATTYQPIATTQQAFISSQFKYNLVNPVDSDAAFRLVFNGGWTHSSNGATPNGTNGYADTKLVPSSVLTLNSTHLSFYSRTSGIVNGQRDIGVFVNGSDPCMSLGTNTGVQLSDSYNFITNRISASIANALGFINGSRVSSTSHKLFKNGSQIGTTDTFANVTSLPNQRVYLGAVNTTPDPTLVSGYSTKQTAFASIGNGLLDAEAAALYSHVQNFQLALNRAV